MSEPQNAQREQLSGWRRATFRGGLLLALASSAVAVGGGINGVVNEPARPAETSAVLYLWRQRNATNSSTDISNEDMEVQSLVTAQLEAAFPKLRGQTIDFYLLSQDHPEGYDSMIQALSRTPEAVRYREDVGRNNTRILFPFVGGLLGMALGTAISLTGALYNRS